MAQSKPSRAQNGRLVLVDALCLRPRRLAARWLHSGEPRLDCTLTGAHCPQSSRGENGRRAECSEYDDELGRHGIFRRLTLPRHRIALAQIRRMRERRLLLRSSGGLWR